MEHAFDIMRRIIKDKGVDPAVMLGYLLTRLQSSHVMQTMTQHRAAGEPQTSSVAKEVMMNAGFMKNYTGREDFPVSLLTAVEQSVQMELFTGRLNLQHGSTVTDLTDQQKQQRDALEQKVKAEETLCLIMKEAANAAEHQGLNASIHLDDMTDEQGRMMVNASPEELAEMQKRKRELKQQGKLNPPPGKFDGLDKLIRESNASGIHEVIIHHPNVLGDTYEELVTNMDKVAAAGLTLRIVPPAERGEK